jgi:hypothetical protein
MREGFRHLRRAGTALAVATLLMLVLPAGVQADRMRSAAATSSGTAAARLSGTAAATSSGTAARTPSGSAPGPLSGPFVALGDSFAAGDLIPTSPSGTPAGCLRSSHDYSADAAAALGMTRYIDAACTGATTADMSQPQSVLLGTNPPQLSFLAADDSVVTLTIGGDDIGFLGILETCATTAAANGATFVDTYTPTIGYDACASADVKDVEGLVPTSPAYPFHPNQRGQQVMADQVLAALAG